MTFIDEGFTEKQIVTEFSWQTIQRYKMYQNLKAEEQQRALKKGSSAVSTRRGNTIRSKQKSAF